MPVCNFLIASDVAMNCTDPIFTGVEQLGYIINRADINTFTRSGNTVSAMSLKTSKKAFQIQQIGSQPFNGTGSAMEENEIRNKFNRTVSFVVLDNSADVSANIIDPLANGEFVCIIENKHKGTSGASAFEVYGLDNGLRATEITETKYENEAGWACTLVETGTPHSATFFYATDYATTKAAVEALLTPAV